MQGFFSENVYSVERAPAEKFYSVYGGWVWPETVLWEATAQTKCFVKTCFAGKEISLSGLWPKTKIFQRTSNRKNYFVATVMADNCNFVGRTLAVNGSVFEGLWPKTGRGLWLKTRNLLK